jgi:hypothetical protein
VDVAIGWGLDFMPEFLAGHMTFVATYVKQLLAESL